jgi:hypothetical protein
MFIVIKRIRRIVMLYPLLVVLGTATGAADGGSGM